MLRDRVALSGRPAVPSLRSRWLAAWPLLLVAAIAGLLAMAATAGLWAIAVTVVALAGFSTALTAGLDRSSFTSGRALDRAAERLRRLEEIAAMPVHTAPLQPYLVDLVGRMRPALNVDFAAVLIVDKDWLTVRAVDGSTMPADVGTRVRIGDGLVGLVARDRVTRTLSSIQTSDVFIPSLGRGITSAAAAPMVVNDRLHGVILVGHRQRVRYEDSDIALLEIAADRIGTAVENARLGESEWRASLGADRAREHLRMLGDTSRTLMRSVDDYEGPLADVVATVADNFATVAAVFLADGRPDDLRVVAARMRGSGEAVHFDIQSLQPVREVMAAGHSRLRVCGEPAAAAASDRPFVQAMKELSVSSYVISPILVRGLAFGALLFGAGPDVRGYRPADQAAIDELGRRIALAIEANLLYREARSSAAATAGHLQRLRNLLDIHLGIGALADRTVILRASAEGAARLFPGATVVVSFEGEQYDGTGSAVIPPLSAGALSLLGKGDELQRDLRDARLMLSASDRRLVTPNSVAVPLSTVDGETGVMLVDTNDADFSDEDESVLGLLGRMVSTTLTNDALNEQTRAGGARLEAIFAASPAAIVTLTPELEVEDFNPAAAELFGWDDTRSAGLPDDVTGCVEELTEKTIATRRPQQSDLTVTADGQSHTLLLMLALVTGGESVVSGFVLVITDDTERRQLATQFQEAQRLEAVGRLAGGLAHDFNNLLTVINGYTDGMLRRLQPDDPNRERIAAIHRAGKRGAELTRQLLTISRQQVVTPVVLQPAVVIDEITDMIRRLVGESVTVVHEPGDDDVRVQIDKLQLEQILLNLASNARDAITGHGTLRLSVHHAIYLPQPLGAAMESAVGDFVELRVADDGAGMDDATLARCLDPLFTTKQAGEGTGLGLSAVYGIAKQNGGDVRITSRPGQGTTVTVLLPNVTAAVTPVDERPLPSPHDKPDTGDETVLLVDDDHEIRWLVWRLLHERGYQTIVADSPLEAIDLMRRHATDVDLLLTDVAMPGMSGAELARAIRAIRPIPVLFMSGYAEKLDRAADRGRSGHAFIAKPFSPDELIDRVRSTLGHVPVNGQGSKR